MSRDERRQRMHLMRRTVKENNVYRWAGRMLVDVAQVRQRQALADEPTTVIRTFGFSVDAGPAYPDFKGVASFAVIVMPGGDGGEIVFASPSGLEAPDWLAGTHWVSQPAKHITKGGNHDQGAFMWLVTDENPRVAAPGAHAVTGPDGSILDVQVIPIKLCGGDCSPASSYYVPAYGATDIFVVVTAEFSK
jgi:hypothetical protein